MSKKLIACSVFAVMFLVKIASAEPQDAEMAQVQAIIDKSHQIQNQQRMREAQVKAGAHYVADMLKDGDDHPQQQLVMPASDESTPVTPVKSASLTPAVDVEKVKSDESQNPHNLL